MVKIYNRTLFTLISNLEKEEKNINKINYYKVVENNYYSCGRKFINFVKLHFKDFLKEQNLKYSLNNFSLFEIYNYEELMSLFKELNIDYKVLKEIKLELFKGDNNE